MGTYLKRVNITTIGLLSNLNGNVWGRRWNHQTQVCAVLHEAVILRQTPSQCSFSHYGVKAETRAAVFNEDEEVCRVTASRDRWGN